MNEKWMKLFFCVALMVIIGGSLLGPVSPVGAGDAISWPQLPHYLAKQSVNLKDLPLCDCPVGLDEDRPNHHVVQIIGNTLYEWKEYEFSDASGQVRLALVMLRPQKQRLRMSEAQILLTASSTWKNFSNDQNRQVVVVPAPTEPSLNRMPGNRDAALRSSVFGADDRFRVGEFVDLYPFNTIAHLSFLSDGSPYTGTGFLISATCLLTAGHNVYWPPAVGDPWSSDLTVTPAQNQPYEGASVIKPYGSINSDYLETNVLYTQDHNEMSEFDFGVVFLPYPFQGISTFMPLEFNYLPAAINIAGYPSKVQDETNSQDMWFSTGSVLGTRGANNQIIDFSAEVTGGNSGSPIWYFNDTVQENRIVGIVSWEDYEFNSGIHLNSMNMNLILSWLDQSLDHDYSYTSYLPFFYNGSNYWTGLALSNHNAETNYFKVEYFMADGTAAGSIDKFLSPNCQTSFVVEPSSSGQGWLKISSTAPHHGLGLVGNPAPSTMFDMDIKSTLHQQFIFPHLAANNQTWRSSVLACNPNATAATITYTYYDVNGVESSVQITIPAQGSINDDLYNRFGKSLNGGHMIMQSSQPITAFLLYDSSPFGQNTWRAGLSAMSIQ